MAWQYGIPRREDLGLLRHITLFHDLTDRQLNRLLDAFESHEFKAGQVILREGDQGDRMFIIRSGEVAVSRAVDILIPGRDELHFEKRLAILREGTYFGELAILESHERSATVTAVTEVKAWALRSDTMQKMMKDDVTMGYKVVLEMSKVLCARIRGSNEDITKLLTAFVVAINK